jgi:FkbM family methyltransferase
VKYLLRLETSIRKIPNLYNFLRPLIPVFNIFVTAESDFNGLKYLDFSGRDGVAVDVGFNDGLSSTSIKRYLPKPIIAFEPLDVKLNPIVANKLKRVTILRFGLSDQENSSVFWTPIYRGKKFKPYSSITKDQAAENLSRDLGISQSEIQFESNTVALKTLDSFELNILFLKIDTEGSEYQVLVGGAITIERCSPCILVEIASREDFVQISGYLQTRNYRTYVFERNLFKNVSKWDPSRRNYWFLTPSGPQPKSKVQIERD